MNLNKCERCGCFFTTTDCICPNCKSKDDADISKLKNFLSENEDLISIEDLSLHTGITIKNVNRYLQNEKVNSTFSGLGLITSGNITIGL